MGITSFPAHRTFPLAAGGRRPSAVKLARWRSKIMEDSQYPFIFFGGALSPAEVAFLPLPMAKNGGKKIGSTGRNKGEARKKKDNGENEEYEGFPPLLIAAMEDDLRHRSCGCFVSPASIRPCIGQEMNRCPPLLRRHGDRGRRFVFCATSGQSVAGLPCQVVKALTMVASVTSHFGPIGGLIHGVMKPPTHTLNFVLNTTQPCPSRLYPGQVPPTYGSIIALDKLRFPRLPPR